VATYVFGDLQGCFKPFKKLLKKIDYQPNKDVLWFVGDLVNRGPDSLACLRFVKNLGKKGVCVLGNHDLSLLASWYSDDNAPKTLKAIWKADDVDELLDWLKTLPLAHYDKKFDVLMVHAGVPNCWDLEQTLQASDEIQKVLQGKNALKFFKAMWGDEPKKWSENLEGIDRLRYMTNALTRMRYCKKNGKLDFETKCHPDKNTKKLRPWFELAFQSKMPTIVFGHWASLMGETHSEKFIGLDTGCVWGNYLTAYRLDDGQYFHQQAASKKSTSNKK